MKVSQQQQQLKTEKSRKGIKRFRKEKLHQSTEGQQNLSQPFILEWIPCGWS